MSLEGSVRYFPELIDGGKDAVRNVTPARVAVPLLYVAAQPDPDDAAGKGTRYSFIDEMRHADVYLVTMQPMQHVDFASINQRFAGDDDFGQRSRDEVALAYGWAARYTLRFLDAQLKNDAGARAFIDSPPAANGVPAQMLTVAIRRKQADPPPTWETFAARLAAEGFDQAIPVYAQLQAQGAAFKVTQNDFIGWAANLKAHKRFAQAREVYRLGDHLHPSLGAKLDLAEMQAMTGQPDAAAQTYRRVIEADPSNATARNYLEQHAPAP